MACKIDLNRDWTHAPCSGSTESQPLDCQGSLSNYLINKTYSKSLPNMFPSFTFLWFWELAFNGYHMRLEQCHGNGVSWKWCKKIHVRWIKGVLKNHCFLLVILKKVKGQIMIKYVLHTRSFVPCCRGHSQLIPLRRDYGLFMGELSGMMKREDYKWSRMGYVPRVLDLAVGGKTWGEY